MRRNEDVVFVLYKKEPLKFLHEFLMKDFAKHARLQIYLENGENISLHKSGNPIPLPETLKKLYDFLKNMDYIALIAIAELNDGDITITYNTSFANFIVTYRGELTQEELHKLLPE